MTTGGRGLSGGPRSGEGRPPVAVVGGGLAGLAAALRLAKAGHPVRLHEATDILGGRWAARTVELDGQPVVVDDVPAVLELPAPWRDLFRKSGRTLADELARSSTALVAAEPATYVFADGSTLPWPTDRGELFAVHERRYGTATAARWRGLVDRLDDVWQTVRRLGWETEMTGKAQLTGPVRRRVLQGRTVSDLAEEAGHPNLAAVVRAAAYRQGSDPATTPAWCAVVLSVQRRFGRWVVQTDPAGDDRDRTGRASALVDAMVARLATRQVEVRLAERIQQLYSDRRRVRGLIGTGGRLPGPAVVWTADPWQLPDAGLPGWPSRPLRRQLRRLRPASAPAVRHELHPAADAGPRDRVSETVALDGDGVPVVTYRRPVRAGTLTSVHDWRARRPDPSAGASWLGFDSWLDRPPIRSGLDGLLLAGPWSPAGNGPAATILSGALASYAVHELLGSAAPADRSG